MHLQRRRFLKIDQSETRMAGHASLYIMPMKGVAALRLACA
jgi:hypothetical protein